MDQTKATLLDAVARRVEGGHDYKCAHSNDATRACDCGHDALAAALADEELRARVVPRLRAGISSQGALTEPDGTPRERAVERLAAFLTEWDYDTINSFETLTGDTPTAVEFREQRRQGYRPDVVCALPSLLRSLGLVAVDPALVADLRRATSDAEHVGGVLDFTAREKARAALADAILAQLGPKP